MKRNVISFMWIPLLLASCMTVPNGPSNMALPGTGKDYMQFRADDSRCKQDAMGSIDQRTVNQHYNASLAGTTALSTAIGAAVGAAAGGGEGAAIGAGMGALTGSAIGSNTALASGEAAQDRYDNTYYQCMYAAGHRIPVPASMAQTIKQRYRTSAAPTTSVPPPPPGYAKP